MRELREEEIRRLHMIAGKKGRLKLKAAIYARKSREDITELSLTTQIEECRTFIGKYDYLIDGESISVFSEDNASGMYTEYRDELQKLLREVKSGNIDVIVVSKSDRFSRDSANMTLLIQELDLNQAYLIALDDMGDDSAAGVLIKQIFWATNEFHVRRSAEDVMKVHTKLVKDGFTVGGPGNFGYDVINRKYVINAEEALAVNLVFDLFIAGKSYTEIADELELKGYKPRKSSRFSPSTILSILTNKRNCGISIWNSHEKRKERKRVIKELFPEVESEDVVVEAIVSKEGFDWAQKILKDRAVGRRNEGKSSYLLTGLIQCTTCNGAMTGNTQKSGRNKQTYRTYHCKNHSKKHGATCATKDVRVEYLESYILDQITYIINDRLNKTGFEQEIIDKYLENESHMLTRLKRDRTKYQDLLSKMTIGLYQATSEAVIRSTQLEIEKTDRLVQLTEGRIRKIEDKMGLVDATVTTVTTKKLRVEDIFINDEVSKRIIRQFISQITISNQDIIID